MVKRRTRARFLERLRPRATNLSNSVGAPRCLTFNFLRVMMTLAIPEFRSIRPRCPSTQSRSCHDPATIHESQPNCIRHKIPHVLVQYTAIPNPSLYTLFLICKIRPLSSYLFEVGPLLTRLVALDSSAKIGARGD
jgi:hypothetical protein